MNHNTHYLDLSAVYGSDDQVAREVRTFKNGALNVTRLRNGYHYQMDLLPPDEIESQISSCALSKAVTGIDPPPEVKCFKAGEMNKQFRIENLVKIVLASNQNKIILQVTIE